MLDDLTIGGLVDIFRRFEDVKSTSLPQYTKRCMISSRVYIQNEISAEEIIPDILRNLHNIYVGYILTAVQMNTFVTNNRTVRDLMSTVATENLKGDDYIGVESIGNDFAQVFNNEVMFDRGRDAGASAGRGSKAVDLKDISYPSGRVIEVEFAAPQDPKATFKINMFVQLLPRVIPAEVSEAFVTLNFKRSIQKRWLQYKSGEISFWKDFVGQLDLLKKRRKALKGDKSGDLKNMMDRQKNSLVRQLLKITGIMPDMQNIANSILILDAQSFKRYCSDAHINFKKAGDRQRFFSKSFSMGLVTVDPMHNIVEMYMNGIDAKCEYTFNQLVGAAKKENMNLVNLMSQMSQGQAPRF